MKAFNNDPKVKADILEQFELFNKGMAILKAAKKDPKIQAVGNAIKVNKISQKDDLVYCTISSGEQELYHSLTDLGIPERIQWAKDAILMHFSSEERAAWNEKLFKAIPVGADLSFVWPEFAIWLLTDDKYGVIKYAETYKQRQLIRAVCWAYAVNSPLKSFIEKVDENLRKQISLMLAEEIYEKIKDNQSAFNALWTAVGALHLLTEKEPLDPPITSMAAMANAHGNFLEKDVVDVFFECTRKQFEKLIELLEKGK